MHYKNGREAKVGDPVVGKVYNQSGIVAGTLLSVTPGTDACSALVGFVNLKEPSHGVESHGHVVSIQGTENHGATGQLHAALYKRDYTHCGNLLHADDAFGEPSA